MHLLKESLNFLNELKSPGNLKISHHLLTPFDSSGNEKLTTHLNLRHFTDSQEKEADAQIFSDKQIVCDTESAYLEKIRKENHFF